jgi:hypothetical protein
MYLLELPAAGSSLIQQRSIMVFQQPVWQDRAINRPRTPYSVKVFILFD